MANICRSNDGKVLAMVEYGNGLYQNDELPPPIKRRCGNSTKELQAAIKHLYSVLYLDKRNHARTTDRPYRY